MPGSLTIMNARVFDGWSADLYEGNLVIEDGTLTAIGSGIEGAGDVLDAEGSVVVPGFIEAFIRNRGIIKDVEAELGISYPTVRARLDETIRENGCTVLYLQQIDEIFVESYAELFTDGLAAAQNGETLLYRVTDAGFVPVEMEVTGR